MPALSDRVQDVAARMPEAVVASSEFPAELDSRVYPEFGMDDPVYAPRSGENSAAAFDGTNYLVVRRETGASSREPGLAPGLAAMGLAFLVARRSGRRRR